MMHTKKIVLGIVVMATMIATGCSDKNSTDPRTEVFKKLKGEWQLQSVTLDDQELEGYDDFVLVMAGPSATADYTYTCSNRPSLGPWSETGTWQFAENFEQKMIRDRGSNEELMINYVLSEHQLILRFLYNGDGYAGRVASASGEWEFTFIR